MYFKNISKIFLLDGLRRLPVTYC